MASIRKRGKRWQVQVRRQGCSPASKSFIEKADALRWAREQEVLADRREWRSPQAEDGQYLRDLLARYQKEVSAGKRSPSDTFHIRQIVRHPISSCKLQGLTAEMVAGFRDDRLRQVAPSTVRREMALLGHALKIAQAEWGLVLRSDPFSQVRKPPAGRGRNRRLEPAELKRLIDALQRPRNPLVRQVVLFALATGMRRGEVLSLAWENINWHHRTALLPLTKNGTAREVPLSPSAIRVLQECQEACRQGPEGRVAPLVFPISANALRLAWERVKRRAGVEDLRFHDLRHEAISRFFEMGLSIPEVAVISGHKEVRMLMAYTHLRPEDIVKKLA